ncbi:MAG: proton-translocating transhydrogenase family protein [Holosporales bacterium]|jgi:NAD(P) transhydrogenase subunit alpha|nr:proton-translocating transhydrogenase family protein [Holosporales bacterium]
MNVQVGANAIVAKANEALYTISKLTGELSAVKAVAARLSHTGSGGADFLGLLTIFVLACFVGYFVVWSVTPALHSPLMAVTNAISSAIIIGAIAAIGTASTKDLLCSIASFTAVFFASVNIFGGFLVTQRMLSMFKRRKGSTR